MIFREVEDRDLIAKARQGDVEAYNLLVSRWEKRIFNYLLRLVSNREDALDISQETFLKAYQNLRKLDDPARFSAWLFRIAHNLAMDHFRAGRRWQPEEDVPEPPGSEELSAEDEAMHSIGRQSMLELIDDLSPEQRQVLTLKFVFNFGNSEVATILGKTEGAVKSLQHRALVSLQKQLEKRPQ